jgi:excisionase family DNA binding protein
METNQLLKGKDVARILNISLPLAYRLLESGEIKAIRFGRTVRCRPQDLDTFLTNHQSGDHLFNISNPGIPHE